MSYNVHNNVTLSKQKVEANHISVELIICKEFCNLMV